MLEKTIKQIFRKKIKDWISSIPEEEEEVRKAIRENVIITGGAFASLMQNEDPKDFDVYFRTKESLLIVARYYTELFNSRKPTVKAFVVDGGDIRKYDETIYIRNRDIASFLGTNDVRINDPDEDNKDKDTKAFCRMVSDVDEARVKLWIPSSGISRSTELVSPEIPEGEDPVEYVKSVEKYMPVFMSSNAITLSDKIQIVVRFYGEPEKIHETYDFEHTKAYWSSWNGFIDIPKRAYECVMNKTLVYSGSRYPVCSVVRMRKFIQRGWHINAGQILKMAMQISALDLCDVDVLEDQLVGVDSLYFTNLINQFREAQEKNSNFVIEQTYINKIIDSIF